MRIVLSGSISFIDEMRSISDKLVLRGHRVVYPGMTDDITEELNAKESGERTKIKIASNAMLRHVEEIRYADVLLVVNLSKNGIDNYIGASVFQEISYAYLYGKAVYLLNMVPEQNYIKDELMVMITGSLGGDLGSLHE
jgi:hypothetical protein